MPNNNNNNKRKALSKVLVYLFRVYCSGPGKIEIGDLG